MILSLFGVMTSLRAVVVLFLYEIYEKNLDINIRMEPRYTNTGRGWVGVIPPPYEENDDWVCGLICSVCAGACARRGWWGAGGVQAPAPCAGLRWLRCGKTRNVCRLTSHDVTCNVARHCNL